MSGDGWLRASRSSGVRSVFESVTKDLSGLFLDKEEACIDICIVSLSINLPRVSGQEFELNCLLNNK